MLYNLVRDFIMQRTAAEVNYTIGSNEHFNK